MSGDGAVSGAWAAGCESEVAERGYARYYSFTLAAESEVTVTLKSTGATTADTYLYLRRGEERSGTPLYENDDHQGSTAMSQIQAALQPGGYTIEATTYTPGQTGGFTLTIAGLGAAVAPQSCSVGLTLDPGDRCGYQDFSIEVDSSGTAIMRFTGDSVDFANLSLVRNGNSWNIEVLP